MIPPQDPGAPEAPRRIGTGAWLLLVGASLAVSAAIGIGLVGPMGLSFSTSLLVVALFLCTDLLAIGMVWYMVGGGTEEDDSPDEPGHPPDVGL